MIHTRQCLGCFEPARPDRDFCSNLCEHLYVRERELNTPTEPVESISDCDTVRRVWNGHHKLNLQNSA